MLNKICRDLVCSLRVPAAYDATPDILAKLKLEPRCVSAVSASHVHGLLR
jgi:hypothetical protein